MDNDTSFLFHALVALRLRGHDLTEPRSTFTYNGWKTTCKRCKQTFKLIPGKTKETDLTKPCK